MVTVPAMPELAKFDALGLTVTGTETLRSLHESRLLLWALHRAALDYLTTRRCCDPETHDADAQALRAALGAVREHLEAVGR